MMDESPAICIIILNWNGWKDTIECLESIFGIEYSNYSVIVVDNDSTNDSINKIKEYAIGNLRTKSTFFEHNTKNKPISFLECSENDKIKIASEKLFIIKNQDNYGFSKGNNIGIKFSLDNLSPDYILLINNDTVVDKNFLGELIKLSEIDENITVIGPKIYYYDYNGKSDVINFAGGKINWLIYPGYHHIKNDPKSNNSPILECDWITGAAMMIKIKNYKFPLLNEEYFFGCEDVDFCLNLKKENKIAVALNSVIWHKIGISRDKKINNISINALSDFKTNITFLKKNSPYYFLLIPFYLLQVLLGILKINLKAHLGINIK